MPEGLVVPAASPVDQPGGEIIDSVEVTHQSGSEVASAGGQGDLAVAEPIVVGSIALELTRVTKRRYQVTARRLVDDLAVAVDTIDLGKASPAPVADPADPGEAGPGAMKS
jgi:hypothetical protein